MGSNPAARTNFLLDFSVDSSIMILRLDRRKINIGECARSSVE